MWLPRTIQLWVSKEAKIDLGLFNATDYISDHKSPLYGVLHAKGYHDCGIASLRCIFLF